MDIYTRLERKWARVREVVQIVTMKVARNAAPSQELACVPFPLELQLLLPSSTVPWLLQCLSYHRRRCRYWDRESPLQDPHLGGLETR